MQVVQDSLARQSSLRLQARSSGTGKERGVGRREEPQTAWRQVSLMDRTPVANEGGPEGRKDYIKGGRCQEGHIWGLLLSLEATAGLGWSGGIGGVSDRIIRICLFFLVVLTMPFTQQRNKYPVSPRVQWTDSKCWVDNLRTKGRMVLVT